ncbi:MAG: hypothetical protein ABI729_08900, partial [Chitinophagales bacterium]
TISGPAAQGMKFSDAESIDNVFSMIEINKSEKTIIGDVFIRDENGELYDKFHVKLLFNSDLKYSFPKVFEIGFSIPKIADRHVYRNGSFCLALPHEEIDLCKAGISFREFVINVLYKYLVNQSLINNGKAESFLMGEHAHNAQGIIDHYLSIFPGFTLHQIMTIINFTLHRLIAKKSKHLCPCDSGQLLVDCHFQIITNLKSYGKNRLQTDYDTIHIFLNELNAKN